MCRKNFIVLHLILVSGLVFSCSCQVNRSETANSKVMQKAHAFIGDSFTTGFFLREDLAFDQDRIKKVLQNPILPPSSTQFVKIGPTTFEALGGIVSLTQIFEEYFTSVVLENPSLTWPKQIIGPDQGLFLARSGSSGGDASKQAERLITFLASEKFDLQSVTFFFGQDGLCTLNPQSSYSDLAKETGKAIENSITFLGKWASANAHPLQIYLLGPLPLLQLGGSSFRSKKVFAHGQELSCDDLLKKTSYPLVEESTSTTALNEADYLLNFIPPNPMKFCPGLFSIFNDSTSSSQLAASSYIATLRKELKKLADAKDKKNWDAHLKVNYLNVTEKILLQPEMIAQDCYHLSPLGQEQLGQNILQALPSNTE